MKINDNNLLLLAITGLVFALLEACPYIPPRQHSSSEVSSAETARVEQERRSRCNEMYFDANILDMRQWCATDVTLIRQAARQAACQTVENYERQCSTDD